MRQPRALTFRPTAFQDGPQIRVKLPSSTGGRDGGMKKRLTMGEARQEVETQRRDGNGVRCASTRGQDRRVSRSFSSHEAHFFGARRTHDHEARRRPRDRKSDRAHIASSDAPEIIQGVAIAIQCGATKAQFDRKVGIHPTAAEEFVTMRDPVPDLDDVEAE